MLIEFYSRSMSIPMRKNVNGPENLNSNRSIVDVTIAERKAQADRIDVATYHRDVFMNYQPVMERFS